MENGGSWPRGTLIDINQAYPTATIIMCSFLDFHVVGLLTVGKDPIVCSCKRLASCTAMKDFVSGRNPVMKPIYDECIQSMDLFELTPVSLD